MRKVDLLFFCILFLMFVGSFSPTLTFFAIFLIVIVSLYIGFIYYKKPSWHLCKMILILLVFQNFMIGCGAHLGGNTDDNLKYVTQVPFITTIVIWSWFFINDTRKNIKPNLLHKRFIILILCIMFSFFIEIGPINSVLLNLRNMTFFFFAFELGKRCISTKDDLYKLVEFVTHLSLVILICGIVLLYGGYNLYNKIGINEVYIAKGVGYLGRLDGRFTTILVSNQVYRMGSILYEPVNLAYFLAAVLLLCVFTNWTNYGKKIFWSIICFSGLILTYGKGGYLIVASAFLFLMIEIILNKLSKKKAKRKYKITAVIGLIILVLISIFYYIKIGAAAKQHYWGIIGTWSSILNRPYGYGIGTGGNAAKTFSTNYNSDTWLTTGGETAIFSFMYQIGIQGIIMFCLCFIETRCKNSYRIKDIIFNLAYYIPFILIIVGILQDNTFTPQCITLFMFAQGAMSRIDNSMEGVKYEN